MPLRLAGGAHAGELEAEAGIYIAGRGRRSAAAEGATRLAAAAAEIRDMVVAAWRTSATVKEGYPPVEVPKIEAGEVDPIDALKAAD